MKKEYMEPELEVVKMQHQHQLLGFSSLRTTSEHYDIEMDYDDGGDNPRNAW